MGMNPLLDYIVLKDIDPPVPAGKLHRINPDPTAPKYAKVLAVGPGRPSEYSGKTIAYPPNSAPSPVQPGQTVCFHGGAGTLVRQPDGEETRWLLPRDIMAFVTE